MERFKGLSIITPHYNDFLGLRGVYKCLKDQSVVHWEWIVVDDLSDTMLKKEVQNWFGTLNDERLQIIYNTQKTNASICRNIGANAALNDHLVFLDSDDTISIHFVANRLVPFKDFAIFQNNAVIDKYGRVEQSKPMEGNYLDNYLKAKFIWPITAILWNRSYFFSIGGFNAELPRLQDVELAIRGLQNSADYLVVDNPVDFYYNVIPIRERRNFLKPVCDAVYLFLSELLDRTTLKKRQVQFLSGYYYLCAKYLERSGSTDAIHSVKRNLNVTYRIGAINLIKWLLGHILLQLYIWRILSPQLFLRINRKIFKP